MNSEVLAKLTQRFRAEFPLKQADLMVLHQRLVQDDTGMTELHQEIRHKVHFMKGAFGMYGFQVLYDLCESIERLVDQPIERSQLESELLALAGELERAASDD